MVDKTIAVKYPHFLNHSLMMSAETTLLNHGLMMSAEITLGPSPSQPLEEARRCHLIPCARRECQMASDVRPNT